MTPSTRRPWRALAAALAGILLLAGCAGIPTSGPVGTQRIDSGEGGDDVIPLPLGPQAGDSPQELLLGFLRAQRDPRGDFQIARSFLTEEFRTIWRPTSIVRVSDTPIAPVEVDEDSYRLPVRVDALVNAAGNYADLADPQPEDLPYEFSLGADGEWRISAAPEGTLLPSRPFTSAFVASPLYFFDPSGKYLVPDVRWFPDTNSRADRIVTEMLAGQSDWYAQPVLITAFPAGTELGSVHSISAGVTTVDLVGDIAAQSTDAKRRMQQQLTASLATVTDSSGVELTVGGFPVDVGEGPAVDSVLPVTAKALGLADDSFGFLSPTSVERLPGLSAGVEALSPLGATLAREDAAATDRVAVRAADGVWLVRSDADPLRVDQRDGLIDPGIDDLGYVWSVPSGSPASIIAFAEDGTAHSVPAPYLDGTIRSLDVSRDGARLLVATQTASGPAVWMIGIIRDADGVPTNLGVPLPIAVGAAAILDAAWVDASTIATLSGSGEEAAVDLYRIGGRHEQFGTVTSGVQVVGGNTADGIRVRDADGGVWRRTSSGGWQDTGIVASFLGTQQ